MEEALQVADDALAEELRALAHEAAMDRRRRARAKSHRVIELEGACNEEASMNPPPVSSAG